MDASSLEELLFDPSKCSKLSMEEKRELVYELSRSHGAPEMLQGWTRQEILQILCAEMGKERKYTGLTKLKIIENLLKVVAEKKSQEHGTGSNLEAQPSSETSQRTSKRQRKNDHPNRLPVGASDVSTSNVDCEIGNTLYCKNLACRAKLNNEDLFCKRCSCCICHLYDDNKDPSLWLICSAEPPFQGDSCGMSCHLECALKHERSGIVTDSQDKGLDGSFSCISCGKLNDLLSSWRKQLVTARDTRRVDILCYRLSLSQKILSGTKRYQKVYEIVNNAVEKLEDDVGPLTGLPVKKARGIVNRLSSGPEVQRLCAFAVESLDSLLSDRKSDVPCASIMQDNDLMASKLIRFEDICPSSLTVILSPDVLPLGNVVGYTLWHRKVGDLDYAPEPTCTMFPPNTRFMLSGLAPATDYLLKVVSLDSNRELGVCEVRVRTSSAGNEDSNFNSNNLEVERSQSPPTNCSSLSNPSSVEDETNNIVPCNNVDENRGDNYLSCSENADKVTSEDIHDQAINFRGKSLMVTAGDRVSLFDEKHSMGKIGFISSCDVNLESNHPSDALVIEETSTDNGSNTPLQAALDHVPFVGSSEAGLPITPCKLENVKDSLCRKSRLTPVCKDLEDGSGKDEPQAGSSSKKRSAERRIEEFAEIGDKDFEYYVKVIRWLECHGHIEMTFRQKFLTWYSLRATAQEMRIVKVFIDTLLEDPASLAGQLIDTFSEVISNKRSSVVPAGFCLKLWH